MKGTFFHRLDTWVRHLLPFTLTMMLVLLNVMPTRLPGFAEVAPLLPFIGVYYWAIYRPDLLPPWVAFLLGLLNDTVSGTPLGVSSLTYLLVHALTASQRRFFHGKSFLVAWWGFGLVGIGAMALQWGLISLVVGHLLEPRAVMFELLMTVSFYPMISWLFARTQLALLRRA